jgi:hypothetical protein
MPRSHYGIIMKYLLLFFMSVSAQAGWKDYKVIASIEFPGGGGVSHCIQNCGGYSQGNAAVYDQSSGSSPSSGHQVPTYASHAMNALQEGFGSHHSMDAGTQARIDYGNDLSRRIQEMHTNFANQPTIQHNSIQTAGIEYRYELDSLIDPNQIADVAPVIELHSQGNFRAELDQTLRVLSKIDPLKTPQYVARDFGIESVRHADQAQVDGNHDDANFYKELAEGFTELALGIHPLTGLTQSAYELIRGKSFIGGHELSTFQRGVAFAGVVTLGGGRSAFKLGSLLSRITVHVAKKIHIAEAISAGTRFLSSRAGRIFSHTKGGGYVAEEVGYQFFEVRASKAFHYAEDHIYARVIETKFADAIARGEKPMSLAQVTFVTAYKDIEGMKGIEIAERLSMYMDKEMTVLRRVDSEFSIIKFKLTPNEIRNFEREVKGEFSGFIEGGFTRGGAREHIISPDTLSELIKEGKITGIDIERVIE